MVVCANNAHIYIVVDREVGEVAAVQIALAGFSCTVKKKPAVAIGMTVESLHRTARQLTPDVSFGQAVTVRHRI